MSTPVDVRLSGVEVAVSDLVAAVAAPLDTTADTLAESPVAHLSRAGLAGVRSSSVENVVRLGSDAAALGLAVAVVRPSAAHAVLWAMIVLLSFAGAGLYAHHLRLSALDDVPAILVGSAVGLVGISFANGPNLSRAVLVAGLAGCLAVLGRGGAYSMLRRWRSRGVLSRDTVLVGTGSRAAELVARIHQHPDTGLRVRGVLGAQPADLYGLPISGEVADLPGLIRSGVVDTLIVGDATSEEEQGVIEALRTCSASTEIFVLPRLSELSTPADDEVWGVPLQRLKRGRSRMRMAVKRGADVTIAAAALLAVSWLIAIAALAVRLELGRGVIYRQERVGLNGRRFQLLKLRSMRPLPPGSSSEWAVNADRTGRVGAFIRRYSIDELPQLVNVLRGDMSLVGPRPERPEFVEQFEDEFPSYIHRHRVMVGLTGLAAVEGLRGDTSIADRAYFDNWYIEHWSLWLDIKIMVRTASALLRATGS
jgi:exopolysaccharide biosynthesis polyprenyl glycosylphosphotransferase